MNSALNHLGYVAAGGAVAMIGAAWGSRTLLATLRRERLKTRIVAAIGTNQLGNTTADDLARRLRLDIDSPRLITALAELRDADLITMHVITENSTILPFIYQLKRTAG